mgnify:CR=1 FL=1
MNAKWRVLIPILGMVGLLSGCAGPMPKPDAREAWVGFREEPDAVLLAANLDGKRLDDGRYFEVPPGKHRLDMTLIVDGVGDNDEQNCSASVNFGQFKPGAHYKLVESSLGQDYSINLEDNTGKQLGHTASVTCLPG